MVDNSLMPCIYSHTKDITSLIEQLLTKQQLKQIQDNKIIEESFNPSDSLVYHQSNTLCNKKDPPKISNQQSCIEIFDNFVNFIKPALQLKFAGTENKYENEKEIRAIFTTSSNVKENTDGNKKFIEIKLESNLFFDSLQCIKINPNTSNKENLLNELNKFINQLNTKHKTIKISC